MSVLLFSLLTSLIQIENNNQEKMNIIKNKKIQQNVRSNTISEINTLISKGNIQAAIDRYDNLLKQEYDHSLILAVRNLEEKVYLEKSFFDITLNSKELIIPDGEKLIFTLPIGFQKKYTHIKDKKDISIAGVHKYTINIQVPYKLSRIEIENNIKNAINEFILENKNTNALAIYVYTLDETKFGAYTVAQADFAPNGDWGDANKDYYAKDNKLNIEYAKSYWGVLDSNNK